MTPDELKARPVAKAAGIDRAQIVDWVHAIQHLTDVAHALFPDQPTQAVSWFKARQDDLFLGNIHAVTAHVTISSISVGCHMRVS